MDWTIQQALRLDIGRVVVTTDYAEHQFMRGAIYHRRPPHLCGDHVPMAQVICEVLAGEQEWPSLIALLQVSSPTRTDETVRECIRMVTSENWATCTTWGGMLGPNGSCYVFPPNLLPPLEAVDGDAYGRLETGDIDINTLEDFRAAEAVMKSRLTSAKA